jgi:molecular chaperone DnaK (HSP70)
VKRLPDIAPYTIGLMVEGERFAPLIEKGVTIDPDKGYTCPLQSFYNQVDSIPQIRVEIYKQKGEGRFIYDTYTTESGEERPSFERIGRFFIDNLPARPAGKIKVDVTCEITPKGDLKVTAMFEGQPWPREGGVLRGWY